MAGPYAFSGSYIRIGAAFIEGVDWLAHGQGGMRFWVLGLLPAVNRTNDEDFRRRRSQLRQESGLAGAFVFLVCMASFQPFTIVPFLLAAVVGAAAGVAAEAMGDRSEIWLFTALVGGVLLAPVVKGMTFLIFLGAIAGGGWLTGFVREVL